MNRTQDMEKDPVCENIGHEGDGSISNIVEMEAGMQSRRRSKVGAKELGARTNLVLSNSFMSRVLKKWHMRPHMRNRPISAWKWADSVIYAVNHIMPTKTHTRPHKMSMQASFK